MCSNSFVYPLIVTILDNALRAAQTPLYKQPFMYIPCMNDNTVFTSGVQGSVLLQLAKTNHRLRTDSYRLRVVVLHESAITSVISLGRFVFQKLSLMSERLIISFSGKLGVLLILSMVKSVYLEEEVLGNFSVMIPSWETKTVFSTML